LVSASQDLTLAVVPEFDPVTTSLYKYVPTPTRAVGGAIVTVGGTVYPTPGFAIPIELILCPNPTIGFATAVSPVPTDPVMVTIGEDTYPVPLEVTTKLEIPFLIVSIEQVAAAPEPPPPENVIDGAIVYPAPAFVSMIDSIEYTPALDVVIATADASYPPNGADVIATVGVDV
jgi:hypothetical protein